VRRQVSGPSHTIHSKRAGAASSGCITSADSRHIAPPDQHKVKHKQDDAFEVRAVLRLQPWYLSFKSALAPLLTSAVTAAAFLLSAAM
jgi:hypothetical protein